MSKLLLASSLVAVSSTIAFLPVACATRASDEETVSIGTQALVDDAGLVKGAIVISAVYSGGGASATAKYKRDYVELLNRTKAPIVLDGLSLQYAAPLDAFGASGILPLTGTIGASSYFLVALAPTGAGGPPEPADLPVPDQNTTGAGSLQLAITDGKIALAPNTDALACGTSNNRCAPAKVLDLVGYGSVGDFEGTASAGALSDTKAATRKGAGCTDANDNKNDFEIVDAVARNSATTPKPDCATTPPPRDAGTDAGPRPRPPGFEDNPLGDEPPLDGGAARRDAGGSGNASGGSDSGCSATGSSDVSSPFALVGLVMAAGAVLTKRRRRA